ARLLRAVVRVQPARDHRAPLRRGDARRADPARRALRGRARRRARRVRGPPPRRDRRGLRLLRRARRRPRLPLPEPAPGAQGASARARGASTHPAREGPLLKPSICIVAHFAYGALLGGRTGHVGGVERQTTLLARRLAERGHPTTLVT